MTDGISIGMGVHDVGIGIASDIGTLTAFAKTPAELITAMLGNDTTLTGLPTAGTVDVPTAYILVLEPCLVGNGEVTHFTAIEDTQADVALGAFRVDAHLARLSNAGITIMTQHHADVESMQLRTGIRSE